MLEIKHKHHLSLPHIDLSAHQMQLSPVLADDDELAQAIDNAAVERGDDWQLSERPDTTELTTFWQSVEDDVRKDPEWFTFSED